MAFILLIIIIQGFIQDFLLGGGGDLGTDGVQSTGGLGPCPPLKNSCSEIESGGLW